MMNKINIYTMKTLNSDRHYSNSVFVSIFFLFCILGFTIKDTSLTDNQNNIQQTKKVVIIINRVGNTKAFSPMTDISFKTDYSNRIPKPGSYVFIDNNKRLSESVPTYPKYSGSTEAYNVEYFKNITPEIFNGVRSGFEQKGYEVFDMRQISKTWNKSYSEMTVKEIISSLDKQFDYLFILHYMDIGNTNINSKIYKIESTHSGFTSLVFSYSMFNIQKQKRLFSYSPMMPFSVIPSLIYNPEIMTNPDLRKKITVNCKEDILKDITEIKYDFTDDELIELLLNVILNGFQCPQEKFIDCYDECKYYDIKGLLSKIP